MNRLLAAEVAERFDLGPDARLDGDAVRGEQGQVRRLVTARGTFAVKESFGEVDGDAAQLAAEFQARCHHAGACCPRPLPDVDGRFLCHVGDKAIRVQTWVDIDGPDPMLDPATVGAELAALHSVVVPTDETPHPWGTEPVGAADWQALVEASRGARAPFAEQLAALVPALLEAEQLLTLMTGVQWCHLDLWADNLRGTPGGRACAIDFDNAGPGDPSRELAMVLFEFARTDRTRSSALLTAYESGGGTGRLRAAEDFGLTIAQLHHIVRYQVLNWLAAGDPDARARALAGVREFVDDPLLVPDVERLVRWATA